MSHDKQESEASGDDEQIFEVEALLDKKIHKKKRVYLVRWKGYGEEHDSWEPEANLMESAAEILEEFKAQQTARRSSTTPKPLKKRPVHLDDGDEENKSSSSKKGRMSRSLSKDDSKDDEDYSDSKKSSSRKRAATVPMKKAPPPPKPLGAIGQSWLMESSDDDDEKKEPKKDRENDAGKYSIRRSTRSKSISVEKDSVEKEEKRSEAREAERKAEKERKKLEKQKREEEKRKNANAEFIDASASSVPKLSIKMAKVDNKADRAQEGGLPPLVMKIRRAVFTEGKYFVTVVVDGEEKEIPLDEVWKLNPYGLMQHLISKYPFE